MPNQPSFADVACPPWPLLLMSRWPLLARLLARLLAAGLHVCCNTACTFAGRWPLLLACEASLPLTISPHALLLPAILLAADARCSQARPRERVLLLCMPSTQPAVPRMSRCTIYHLVRLRSPHGRTVSRAATPSSQIAELELHSPKSPSSSFIAHSLMPVSRIES